MSLLAIDVGNTRLKWALYEGNVASAHASLLTTDATDIRVLAREWQALQPTAAIVSNVAGVAISAAIHEVLSKKNIAPQFIASIPSQCGVTNGYDNPSQLGTDRWAALIGAHQAAPLHTAKVVVMAGTALTVDALTADGQFLGGIIIPGLGVMRQALHLRTAQLPLENGQFQMFPTNTLDAIASGAIEASIGAIYRMVALLGERMSEHDGAPTIIASGGALALLAPHAPFPLTIHENLVLEGLLHIAIAADEKTNWQTNKT